MSAELPWPRADDVLFASGHDWLNACVGWTSDQWHGYIEGYKLAADLLVQQVERDQRNQDLLIYPIVFLYRHALEVSLKHLIWVGSQLRDTRPELSTHHRLVPLWRQCRPIIEEVWPHGSKEDLEAAGALLEQFETRDPNSTVFRYPVTKEGLPAHSSSEHIHIGNFAKVANGVLSLLDGCASGFSQCIQHKWDTECEQAE